jgi:hypothetical protein
MPRLRRKDTDNLYTIFPNQEERVGRINHNAPPLLLCAGPSWEIEIVSDHVHPNTLLQFAPGILRSPIPPPTPACPCIFPGDDVCKCPPFVSAGSLLAHIVPRIVTRRLLGDEFKNSGGRRKGFPGVAARTMFLTRILTAAQ